MVPSRRLRSVTIQNVGIVTDHVSMHHGQSTASEKMLWEMSHPTNTRAPSAPTLSPAQNQRGKGTPPSSSTPIVMTTGQAMRPIKLLASPKTEPCHESRFVEHFTSTPML